MQNDRVTGYATGKHQLDQCHSYLRAELRARRDHPTAGALPPGPALTISHQTGAGAHEMAALVVGLLQAAEPAGAAKWTVFDRDLVSKVLEEHHLPQSLAERMPEDRRTWIQDLMEELVGLRPTSWDMVPKIMETVLHLANSGHVVLVGRGANLITAKMPNVFHVRLIASLPERMARIEQLEHLDPDAAAEFITNGDRGRERFVKTHFHVQVEDELLYHLVINTGRIPLPDAAQLIADGARRCFRAGAAG
ncbi:MAG: cytidylate kinase-like family protein [Holophaga sp.]